MQTTKIHNIISLDVGEKRVGIARANSVARIAEPLITLTRDEHFWVNLQALLVEQDVGQLVIGLPRNLQGKSTAQTEATEKFIKQLGSHCDLPVATQDEALTSHQAETELQARGRAFKKGEVDALAATYILEDYLQAQGN
jgi:putative holliday junction resolvase